MSNKDENNLKELKDTIHRATISKLWYNLNPSVLLPQLIEIAIKTTVIGIVLIALGVV